MRCRIVARSSDDTRFLASWLLTDDVALARCPFIIRKQLWIIWEKIAVLRFVVTGHPRSESLSRRATSTPIGATGGKKRDALVTLLENAQSQRWLIFPRAYIRHRNKTEKNIVFALRSHNQSRQCEAFRSLNRLHSRCRVYSFVTRFATLT